MRKPLISPEEAGKRVMRVETLNRAIERCQGKIDENARIMELEEDAVNNFNNIIFSSPLVVEAQKVLGTWNAFAGRKLVVEAQSFFEKLRSGKFDGKKWKTPRDALEGYSRNLLQAIMSGNKAKKRICTQKIIQLRHELKKYKVAGVFLSPQVQHHLNLLEKQINALKSEINVLNANNAKVLNRLNSGNLKEMLQFCLNTMKPQVEH